MANWSKRTQLPVPDVATVPLKKSEEFEIIGKPLPRKDIPEKVDGSAIYGLDVRVPGMVYAMVARCPVFGGKVKSFDASKAKALEGVQDAFVIDPAPDVHSWGGVAVIAGSTYTVTQAKNLLQIEWDYGPHAAESSETLRRQFRRLVDSRMKVVINRGNADDVIGRAPQDKRIDCDYELPFQAHATMEPMNCTVYIGNGRAEAWAPAQGPEWVMGVIAQVSGLPPEKIQVHTTYLGGGFGRRYQADFVMEAAQIAKRVSCPVHLVWSREDDMTHDFYRPASYHSISGAVDSSGNILGWRHKSTSTSIVKWWNSKETPESSELGCAAQLPYLVQNYKGKYLPAASGGGPKHCEISRYDALSIGLDALLRETQIRNSALNRNIRSPAQSEVFRRTMGQVSRNYWATVSLEERRERAQKGAHARWNRR